MSNFGSFSYFQTSFSLGVEQGPQNLQKFDINDLRLLFHCNILISRKCPHKPPFKAQCPTPHFNTFLRPCMHQDTKIVEPEMSNHCTLNDKNGIYSIKSYIEHHYNVFVFYLVYFWFLGIFEQFRCEYVTLNMDENSLSYHIMS